MLHAGLGDTAQVFAWLQEAVETRDNDSVMAPFRRDPRGRAVLVAMGLAGATP